MPKVKKSVSVAAPVDIVYETWRNFANFPSFMSNIEEVRVVSGGQRSHWKAKGPLGMNAEWDAEVTLEEPRRAIGWRSIEGERNVKTAGRVNFEDTGDRTVVEVTIEYDAPAGPLGDAVAKIFSDPERQVEDDLMRFKEMMEANSRLASNAGSGEPLGASIGAMSEADLESAADTNSGIAPTEVDDPATRDGSD
jgi:uncharacterized membrane protein